MGRELVFTAGSQVNCVALDREAMNIGNPVEIREILRKTQPQLLINAAAYTAVDKAESESDAAWKINALAPGLLAEACAVQGVRMVHVSTDFVFDGEATRPYAPDAPCSPISEYGRGKLAGEKAVRKALPEALIVRTGWLYSRFGANFVKTMLRLMAERDELAVVCDQVGTPTWARGLAQALWAVADRPQLQGIYHWSDEGVCSWYDFARAIYQEGRTLGLLTAELEIKPIPGSSYPTPAHRPAYSVLDKTSSWRDFELEGVAWREQLRAMLSDMKKHECEGQ